MAYGLRRQYPVDILPLYLWHRTPRTNMQNPISQTLGKNIDVPLHEVSKLGVNPIRIPTGEMQNVHAARWLKEG